ncbi:YbaB/EbfC family nucleoid-associated protein [Skermania sp. ID1734]|uniref:YbaB/EbfC family nucleoid-associated protein n=1 Tax=Skermania sp. ID1734 TaxID=2597516 RepID=UPI00117CAFCB|nr:YbaB/EbfC family nucleoid-associated protein [Skermania sp. ID1734]TSE02041.1 YbaB/EbfC family nucleoid-associated protein [Skermania sp. ID1734]
MTTASMQTLIDSAESARESLAAAQEQLRAVRTRCTTGNGAVTAEVDSHGALCGLWLDESITESDPDGVGALIIEAAHRAAAAANGQRSAIVANCMANIQSFATPVGKVTASVAVRVEGGIEIETASR